MNEKICPKCKEVRQIVPNRYYMYKCSCGWEGDYREMEYKNATEAKHND